MLSILSYVSIRRNSIAVNGKLQYSRESVGLSTFLQSGYENLEMNYPKFFKMDPLSQGGILAAEYLTQHIKDQIKAEERAIVLANSSSSLDTDIRFSKSAEGIASPALFVYTLPNIVSGEICIKHHIKGETAFFVGEKFEPELLVPYVESLFDSTPTKLCIAGWTEVIGENHDIFLYLVMHESVGSSLPHTPEQVRTLYYS